MFADSLHSADRKVHPRHRAFFVRKVSVRSVRRRNPTVERLILVSWILIAAKSLFVWWACARYAVPFNPLWVIAPTVLMAFLTTVIYYARR